MDALIRWSCAGRKPLGAAARSFIGFHLMRWRTKTPLARIPIRRAASVDRRLARTQDNREGGRQVAGLIDVMSITSPALV
jgi:hypothetical protein